jgi:hypothetical protein
VSELVTGLEIQWSGKGADFVDSAGRVAAQDPTAHTDGPSSFLLREDLLREFLATEKLTICWAILGEKRVLTPGSHAHPRLSALRMSGAYVLSEGKLDGFFDPIPEDPSS